MIGANGGMDGRGNRGRLAIGIHRTKYYIVYYSTGTLTSSVIGDSAKHTYKVNISSNPAKADYTYIVNNHRMNLIFYSICIHWICCDYSI